VERGERVKAGGGSRGGREASEEVEVSEHR
jgi:hypothetical protein